MRNIGRVLPVHRILLKSFIVCAGTLTAAAFLSPGREISASPEAGCRSRVAAPAREHVEITGDAGVSLAQQQLIHTASPNATVTDEQIETMLAAHPELRPAIQDLLDDPDPVVRQQVAALAVELAIVTAQTLPSQ